MKYTHNCNNGGVSSFLGIHYSFAFRFFVFGWFATAQSISPSLKAIWQSFTEEDGGGQVVVAEDRHLPVASLKKPQTLLGSATAAVVADKNTSLKGVGGKHSRVLESSVSGVASLPVSFSTSHFPHESQHQRENFSEASGTAPLEEQEELSKLSSIPETSRTVLGLQTFPALLVELSDDDALGPGYRVGTSTPLSPLSKPLLATTSAAVGFKKLLDDDSKHSTTLAGSNFSIALPSQGQGLYNDRHEMSVNARGNDPRDFQLCSFAENLETSTENESAIAFFPAALWES
ncbi:hypothetical protein ElyMa_003911700 [Elysia marginata]|uniref:Uncharacterized protein n=1 Tax=Elysia marginata TaxID=1093978 RepID=A0AAV4FQQ4_9GAST|nr:hypothetical protein ElyMa_003911700 [Elysia marginata]